MDEFGSGLRSVAEELFQVTTRVQQAVDEARERTYDAEAPGGPVAVTVDGRPRVVEVRLSARQGRRSGPELEDALVSVLNEALNQARTASNAALLDALPGKMRDQAERAAAEALREDNR